MPTLKGTVPWNAGVGKGWIDPRGYRQISVTTNGKRRQIKEHRAVMERHLGRSLEPWELVHHKDGNPLNNDLSNLELTTFGEHTAEHHTGSRRDLQARRSMEAFALMREELRRERETKAELLAALRRLLATINPGNADTHNVGCDCVIHEARAAVARSEGRS